MRKLKRVFVVALSFMVFMGIYIGFQVSSPEVIDNVGCMSKIYELSDIVGAESEDMSIREEVITINEVDWHSEYYKQKAEEEAQYRENLKAQEELRKERELEERRANGELLTEYKGVYVFEGHTETYYNLPMDGIVSVMRGMGFSEEEYPYWVREDGCKMLGDYIMVAADLSLHPRGTFVETSLGTGLVCDTGGFVEWNSTNIDIATDW